MTHKTMILIASFCVFAAAAFNAHATVEPNWPVGTPNRCKSPTDGFIDFENGQDEQVVSSTVPGTQFTTTDGFEWLYADWRTRRYNGPFPQGSYTSNGYFSTWLGPSQGQGRIDFRVGPASYVSVLTSTFSGLQLDAYDNHGVLVGTSGRAASNVNTGTLTRVTVESRSKDIVYVMIHDSGNFWIMDDLCTDAAGVPPAYAAIAEMAKSAFGVPYVWGAKGYDGGEGARIFVPPDQLVTGYHYINTTTGTWFNEERPGLDCSGLTMWAYNRTFLGDKNIDWPRCICQSLGNCDRTTKECVIVQEGAHGQYQSNIERITAQEVRRGDLLFFDKCIDRGTCAAGRIGVMGHVAMFVGPFLGGDGGTYNAVHASYTAGKVVPAVFDVAATTLTTKIAGRAEPQRLVVADYGRVVDARLDAWIVSQSPIHLFVTAPDGTSIGPENALLDSDGYTREVPGMDYMIKEITPGGADDVVAIPKLETGTYFIDVGPKQNAQPTDVFSLDVRLHGKTIILADHVSLEEITKRSFAIEVSPQGGVVESLRARVVIKPGEAIACINPKSNGNTPVALLGSTSVDVRLIDVDSIELDDDSDRATVGVKPIRWAADSDVNRDGYPDLLLHLSTPALTGAGLLDDGHRIFITAQYRDGSVLAGTDVVYVAGSENCR